MGRISMPDTNQTSDRRKMIEIAQLAREIGKSRFQVNLLRKGAENPTGFSYTGVHRTLAHFHQIGIIAFTRTRYRGRNISKLTPKGHAVLKIINRAQNYNVESRSIVCKSSGNDPRRSSSTSLDETVRVQHQELDSEPC